jgi:hypothetical protein
MVREVHSCLERWIHALRGGLMLILVGSWLERWIFVRGGFMLRKMDSCLMRWIHA